ncbi:MAG: Fe-S-containing hydro-lyase [Firmicutes bacterium]|jgi:fumarate hydratase subunit beta|nr:Fe-S-containing hydro-lyase [Candidatus Fermentithermobacillaceae bacterium]
MIRIKAPLDSETIDRLHAGDQVNLSGVIFTARDAAHKRLVETYLAGKELPVDLNGQVVYYVGPCPAKPGRVIGSAGPTTSTRMDPYTPLLLRELGLKGMIGKGNRSQEVVDAIKEQGAVYFLTIGGAAAYLAQRIKKADVIAYPEFGPEAIYRLEVQDFPLIVGIDRYGKNAYQEGRAQYRQIS